MNKLRDAIAAADAAREQYHAHCLSVWQELQFNEPELTAEIRALGFDDPTAAWWVCQPNHAGATPAAWMAAGRGAEALVAIRRATHGIFG